LGTSQEYRVIRRPEASGLLNNPSGLLGMLILDFIRLALIGLWCRYRVILISRLTNWTVRQKNHMKIIYTFLFSFAFTLSAIAEESIVHDDGTGAQISFCLPIHNTSHGRSVVYSTFRISVVRDGKFLLFADLAGKTSDDGKFFIGRVTIPSEFVHSAEILLLGGPPNTSLGLDKKLMVRDFKRLTRAKSWTEQ